MLKVNIILVQVTILILLLGVQQDLPAQDCRSLTKYRQAMAKADSLIFSNDFGPAYDQYNAAKVYCGDSAASVQKFQDSLFIMVNNLKDQLEKEKRVAFAIALSAKALNISDTQPEIAYRMAEEAYRQTEGKNTEVANILLRLYEETGLRGAYKEHNKPVNAIAFSPDGKYLISGSNDERAILWEIRSGKKIFTFSGPGERVESVNFSHDGKFLAVGMSCYLGNEDNISTRVYEVSSGNIYQTLFGHDSSIESVNFSSNGKFLLTASLDRTAILWDLKTGSQLRKFMGHDDMITTAAISPDNKFVLTGGWNAQLILWELSTGKKVREFKGHSDHINSATFSDDGKYIISGGYDKTIKYWDVYSGSLLRTFYGSNFSITDIDISPDGKFLVSASVDYKIRFLNIDNGKEILSFYGHSNSINSVRFSPNGKMLATASNDGSVKIWEIKFSKNIHDFSCPGRNEITFSPDGKFLFSCGLDSSAYLIDLTQGKISTVFSGHKEPISSVGFSPNGRYLLTGSWDSTAILWDRFSKDKYHLFKGFNGWIKHTSFSPDLGWIIIGDEFGNSEIWDITKNTSPTDSNFIKKHQYSRVLGASINQELIGFSDNTSQWINLETSERIRLFINESDAYFPISISPDQDKYILEPENNNTILTVFSTNSGDEINSIIGHKDRINDYGFSPNGKYIVTGSNDETICIWDAESGQKIYSLLPNQVKIDVVRFSPNGKFIVSGGNNETIKVWEMKYPEDIMEWLKKAPIPELTENEKSSLGMNY